jgi:eukaryotic-like serine/threonine-protein kinase
MLSRGARNNSRIERLRPSRSDAWSNFDPVQNGTVVGRRYRIGGCHATGGMCEVYAAIDLVTGRKVAVKVARPGMNTNDPRLAREAAVLAKLSHPGIVRYLGHGLTEGRSLYLVMEWIEGEPLHDRLRVGPITVEKSVLVAAQVAEALACAHARGIVHRDLKPQNLLLEGGSLERVKIIDFGLASAGKVVAGPLITPANDVIGTPAYMAPEMLRGIRGVDARVDVYALGCVLYECLSGRRTFSGKGALATLAKILVEEPEPLSELVPGISEPLAQLVTRMIAKDPGQRPRDAAEVLQLFAALRAVPPRRLARSASEPGTGQPVCCTIRVSAARADEDDGRTASSSLSPALLNWLENLARSCGGVLKQQSGEAVVLLAGGGVPSDVVRHAARCALTLARVLPGRQVVVGTGSPRSSDESARTVAADLRACSVPANEPLPVLVDRATAGLLDHRFELEPAGTVGARLLGWGHSHMS